MRDTYKDNARRLQSAIGRSGGVQRAADIVEQAALTRTPVLANTPLPVATHDHRFFETALKGIEAL